MEWTLASTANLVLDGVPRLRDQAPFITDLACKALLALTESVVAPEGMRSAPFLVTFILIALPGWRWRLIALCVSPPCSIACVASRSVRVRKHAPSPQGILMFAMVRWRAAALLDFCSKCRTLCFSM